MSFTLCLKITPARRGSLAELETLIAVIVRSVEGLYGAGPGTENGGYPGVLQAVPTRVRFTEQAFDEGAAGILSQLNNERLEGLIARAKAEDDQRPMLSFRAELGRVYELLIVGKHSGGRPIDRTLLLARVAMLERELGAEA